MIGLRRFFGWYGAGPLHLVVLVAAFALAGFAALRLFPLNPVALAIWFVVAIVGHDLILLPLYTFADRRTAAVLRRRRTRLDHATWINHVRVPAVLSGVLLLVFLPVILRLSTSYSHATGRSFDAYLGRWLLISATLFGSSALLLVLRLARHRARRITNE